jgi:hypothetical protein
MGAIVGGTGASTGRSEHRKIRVKFGKLVVDQLNTQENESGNWSRWNQPFCSEARRLFSDLFEKAIADVSEAIPTKVI